MRKFIAVISLIALASCASTVAYQPATSPNGAGYSQTQIEDNRFIVTYRAPSGANPRLIEDYALLRAAELTLEQGQSWFIVDRRRTDLDNPESGRPRVGVSVGSGSWGRSSSVGVGVGVNFPLGENEPKAHEATLEIRTGSGEKPEQANVYEALPVSLSLRRNLQDGS